MNPTTPERLADELEALAAKLEFARSDELTGIACEHGWDTKVCPMRGCGDDPDELTEKLLALSPTIITALRGKEQQ